MRRQVLANRALSVARLAGLISLVAVMPASAHVGAGSIDTFSRGFLHPLSGLDHILAMVAVGLYAANLGGRALWLVPSAFIGTMIIGGLLGYYGWPLPMVEAGIALSVMVMGMAIALGVRLPTIAAMALVGVFALFHGHVHGSEGAGLGLAFLPYAMGFVVATSVLHLSGLALGVGFNRLNALSGVLNKFAGGIGLVAGMSLLAGWMAA